MTEDKTSAGPAAPGGASSPGEAQPPRRDQLAGGAWTLAGRPPAAPPPAPLREPLWPAGAEWGWRESLIGLVVAMAPIITITLLGLLLQTAGGDAKPGSGPTLGIAVAAVVLTLVFDIWYLVVAWSVSLRRARRGLEAWGFRRPAANIFWTVPAALVAVYVVSILYSTLVQPEEQQVVQDFPHSAAGIVLFALLACVIAPVFEETFFRGFLFRGFASSWGAAVGAIVSAAVFALSHQQLDIFLPLFALGLALAWVYTMTRSVWGSIALHAVYNLIAVIATAASWVG